jgi:hypothetical protein
MEWWDWGIYGGYILILSIGRGRGYGSLGGQRVALSIEKIFPCIWLRFGESELGGQLGQLGQVWASLGQLGQAYKFLKDFL